MLVVVEPAAALVVEPVESLVVEPVELLAVPLPLECSVPVDEREDEDDDGLGHTFSYTNCVGSPLQVVVDPALYVPFG